MIDEEEARRAGTAERTDRRREAVASQHASSATTAGARWTRVGTSPPAPGTTQRSSEGSVRGSLAALAAAAAVFGPIAFATLHSVYAQFYESFGISPEDVGINSGRVLTTSLVAFGLAFVVWLVYWIIVFSIPTIAVTVIAPTDDDGAARTPAQSLEPLVIAAVLLFLGIAVAREVSSAPGLLEWERAIAWLMPVAVILSFVVTVVPAAWADRLRIRAKHINTRSIWIMTMLAAAAVTANLIVRNAASLGKHESDLVKSGRAVLRTQLPEPIGSARLRALDIQVLVAHVAWLDSPPGSLRTNGCLMYLGSSGGVAFLWDVPANRLLRIPESAAVISTSSTAKRC